MYALSHFFFFFLLIPRPPTSILFPYTTLFRSLSTRQNPSHRGIANPNAFRDPRVHESPHRSKERSHPWVHRHRSRGRRSHGVRASRDDRGAPLHRVT